MNDVRQDSTLLELHRSVVCCFLRIAVISAPSAGVAILQTLPAAPAPGGLHWAAGAAYTAAWQAGRGNQRP